MLKESLCEDYESPLGNLSQLPKNWPEMINEMRSRLENHFYIPTLSNNLRNSSEVFNMSEAVKSEYSYTVGQGYALLQLPVPGLLWGMATLLVHPNAAFFCVPHSIELKVQKS